MAEIHTAETRRGPMMYRMGKVGDSDRSFDVHFWQSQPAEARFDAAWEMVEFAWELKGRPRDELRLQRTVGRLGRI